MDVQIEGYFSPSLLYVLLPFKNIFKKQSVCLWRQASLKSFYSPASAF